MSILLSLLVVVLIYALTLWARIVWERHAHKFGGFEALGLGLLVLSWLALESMGG